MKVHDPSGSASHSRTGGVFCVCSRLVSRDTSRCDPSLRPGDIGYMSYPHPHVSCLYADEKSERDQVTSLLNAPFFSSAVSTTN